LDELGFAHVDLDRTTRQGFAEVILCSGKTPEQVVAIFKTLLAKTSGNVLATRADAALYTYAAEYIENIEYNAAARTMAIRRGIQEEKGHILVVTAGTSDIPVAEEAAVTASLMGNHVERLYDVGVAGLHRIMSHIDCLQAARVLIVIAGMDGVLPSVIGGLVAKPVIAVPTSVGYGANFGGIAPLLTMLNSCAAGVGVMNIDNGFGAGRLASLINQLGE